MKGSFMITENIITEPPYHTTGVPHEYRWIVSRFNPETDKRDALQEFMCVEDAARYVNAILREERDNGRRPTTNEVGQILCSPGDSIICATGVFDDDDTGVVNAITHFGTTILEVAWDSGTSGTVEWDPEDNSIILITGTSLQERLDMLRDIQHERGYHPLSDCDKVHDDHET